MVGAAVERDHAGTAEVEASIQRLFTYAAWADKYDGHAKSVPIRGIALAMNEPVGVIGAFLPDEAPLLGLVSVMAPAIALCVIASLGLLLSLFNVAYAFMEHPIDPNAPEFVQAMQKGSQGTTAAIIQSCFVVVNLLILSGAIQMMRFRTWGLALTASILAMVNFGTFCCIPGLPIGIWTLVILLTPEVRAAFQAVSNQH